MCICLAQLPVLDGATPQLRMPMSTLRPNTPGQPSSFSLATLWVAANRTYLAHGQAMAWRHIAAVSSRSQSCDLLVSKWQ